MKLSHTPLYVALVLGLALVLAGASHSERPNAKRKQDLLIGELGCNSQFGLFLTFQGTADILSQEITMNLDGEPGIEACLTTVPEEFAANAMALGCTTSTASLVPPAGSENPNEAVSIVDFACAGKRDEVVATMAKLSSSVLSFELPQPRG
jgi:hypothetical protein